MFILISFKVDSKVKDDQECLDKCAVIYKGNQSYSYFNF